MPIVNDLMEAQYEISEHEDLVVNIFLNHIQIVYLATI